MSYTAGPLRWGGVDLSRSASSRVITFEMELSIHPLHTLRCPEAPPPNEDVPFNEVGN